MFNVDVCGFIENYIFRKKLLTHRDVQNLREFYNFKNRSNKFVFKILRKYNGKWKI